VHHQQRDIDLARHRGDVQDVPARAQAARDPRFAVTVVPGRGFMYVAYDTKGRSGAKPVQDERVRRAVSMAIDRPEYAIYTRAP